MKIPLSYVLDILISIMGSPKSCTPSKVLCSLCWRILLGIFPGKRRHFKTALRVEGASYCWEQIHWHLAHSKVRLSFLFAIVTSTHDVTVLLSPAPPAEFFAEIFSVLERVLSKLIWQIMRASQVGYMTGKSLQTGKHSLMAATKLIFLYGTRSLHLSRIQPSPLNRPHWLKSGKETTTSSQPKSGELEMSELYLFV